MSTKTTRRREYAQLYQRIWRDAVFLALSVAAQRAYMLLLSQPDLTYAGALPLRVRRWSQLAADTTTEDILAALDELAAARFIIVDPDTEEVLVRSFIRNDGLWKQPKMLGRACREALDIESPHLRATLSVELLRLPADQVDDEVRDTASALVAGHEPPPRPPHDRTPAEGMDQGARAGAPTRACPAPDTRQPTPDSASTGTSHAHARDYPPDAAEPRSDTPDTPEDHPDPSEPDPVDVDGQPSGAPAPSRAVPALRPSAVELAGTACRPGAWRLVAEWRAGHGARYRSATYRAVGKVVDELLRDRADPVLVVEALSDWDSRGRSPEFLRHCYDDAVTRSRAPVVPGVLGSRSTGSKRADGALGFLAQAEAMAEADQLGAGRSPLGLIEGGRSA